MSAEFWDREPLRRVFLEWVLLDRGTRVRREEPLTQRDWCEHNKVPDRTARSWKQHPEFKAELELRREQMKRGYTDAGVDPDLDLDAVAAGESAMPDDATATELIKGKLFAGAMAGGGDPRMIDIWAKTFGKHHINAAAETIAAELSGLDIPQLLDGVRDLADRLEQVHGQGPAILHDANNSGEVG